jgi:hypothetical protein
MPLTRVLRLRGGAVSLRRESQKAERRLDKLQTARRNGIPAQPTQPEPARTEPKIEHAVALIEDTNRVASTAEANGQTWTQAYDQRQRDLRIAASLKRAEARVAAQANITTPASAQMDRSHTGITRPAPPTAQQPCAAR